MPTNLKGLEVRHKKNICFVAIKKYQQKRHFTNTKILGK